MEYPKCRPMFSAVEVISYKRALKIAAEEQGTSYKKMKANNPYYIVDFDGWNDFDKEVIGKSALSGKEVIITEIHYDTDDGDLYYGLGYVGLDNELHEIDLDSYVSEKFLKPYKDKKSTRLKQPEHKRLKIKSFEKRKDEL